MTREYEGEEYGYGAPSRGYGPSTESGQPGEYGRDPDYGYGQAGEYGQYSEYGGQGRGQTVRERARRGIGEVRERTREGVHRAREAGHRARERVSDATRRVSARSRDMARQAQRRGQNAAHQLEDTYTHGRERFEHGLDRHPLAMCVGFFAVGLLVGLSIPRTRREHEWFGDTSEGVLDRARERGYELMQQGVEAGRRTYEATREELREQGLAPDQIRDRARQVLREGMAAARNAAEEAGLTRDEPGRRAGEVRETAQTTTQREIERLQRRD